MSLVLDSSVTLSWYFEDERTTTSQAVLHRVAAQGAVVPALWRFEVANGLNSAIRRKRIDKAYRDASLVDLAALAIGIDPESDGHVRSATLDLADQYKLTVYDAAYLELARRRRLPLATFDGELRIAAEAEGVTLEGIAATRR